MALPELAVPDDAAVLHVDPRPQLVGEAERVGLAERVEVVDGLRERGVVVRDPHLEGNPGAGSLDGLRRYPRDRDDR